MSWRKNLFLLFELISWHLVRSCPKIDYDFKYVTPLPGHKALFPNVPAFTFVGNLSNNIDSIWGARIEKNSLVYPPFVNSSINKLYVKRTSNYSLVNTTISMDKQGFYVFCLYAGGASCRTCTFVQVGMTDYVCQA